VSPGNSASLAGHYRSEGVSAAPDPLDICYACTGDVYYGELYDTRCFCQVNYRENVLTLRCGQYILWFHYAGGEVRMDRPKDSVVSVDTLICVDESDNGTGFEEKERCHLHPTRLHRAFSIFIFNSRGEILLHRRSRSKKTWPGFWTNACCSHPRKGESLEAATARRLKEELGFETPVTHLFRFQYRADYDADYGENEIDHVFVGFYDGEVSPDPGEIEEWRFVETEKLREEMKAHPETYTPWFKIALPRVLERNETGRSAPSDNQSGHTR
jgi:isopentenyl-diphosphate Delta-isomerase